jgi:hypothetical protein
LKSKTIVLLGFALSAPLTVFASGGFIIPSLVINFAWFIILGLVILGLKIMGRGKALIFLSYIGTMLLMFTFFDQLNALEDIKIINYCSAIIPPLAFYFIYRLISDRYKLEDE